MSKPREDEIRRIGRQLRFLREQSGRTLDQLASAAGLSVRAVRELEAGRTNPTLATVVAVADVLGLSIDEILTAARRDIPAADVTRAGNTSSGEMVLTRTLPNPRMKGRLIELAGGDGQRLPSGAAFVHVLAGKVPAALDGGRVHLGPGACVHARPGVLGGLDGSKGRLLVVEAAVPVNAQQERVWPPHTS